MYHNTVGIDGSKKTLTYWKELSRGPRGWLGAGARDVGNAAERPVFSVSGRGGQGRISLLPSVT